MNYNYDEYVKDQLIQMRLLKDTIEIVRNNTISHVYALEFFIKHGNCEYWFTVSKDYISIDLEYFNIDDFLVKKSYYGNYKEIKYYCDNELFLDFTNETSLVDLINLFETESFKEIYDTCNYTLYKDTFHYKINQLNDKDKIKYMNTNYCTHRKHFIKADYTLEEMKILIPTI